MKLKEIKEITQRVEHGAWVKNLPNLPGVSVKVRGRFNLDAARLQNELMAAFSPDQQASAEVQDEVEVAVLHRHILMDWTGIDDAPFSPEVSLEVLSDPEMAVFRRAVVFASNVVAHEGTTTLEDDAKN